MKKILLVLFCAVFASALAASEVLQEVVVEEGETLWSIAQKYMKDPGRWPEILKHNQLPISDNSVPLAGMKLKIPVLLIKENLRKASLVYLLGEVLARKKTEAEWKKAKSNMDVYNEDSLRTLAKSQAHVRFYGGDLLKLDENSLVILRPELRVQEIELLSGALKTSGGKVVTPSATVKPKTQDTVYKTRIRADMSTVVHVEKGKAQVFGKNMTEAVEVAAGYANITLPNSAPTAAVPAPKMKDFEFPEFTNGGKIILPAGAVVVPSEEKNLDLRTEKLPEENPIDRLKNKENASEVVSYRIQIAQDSGFRNILIDRTYGRSERPEDSAFKNSLGDGTYYRRVSFIYKDGGSSKFSPMPMLKIDTAAPNLSITAPLDNFQTSEGLVNVDGKTDPGCTVAINNYPVPVGSDGRFQWSVVLIKEGSNKINIVTKDANGNFSHAEKHVVYAPR